MKQVPLSFEPYTDKYFLRSLDILKKEKLNPFIRAQVFLRSGPGKVFGINEARAIIETYSQLKKNGGRIFSLREGDSYNSNETIMIIEGRVQDIIALETMILGVISAETTKANDTSKPQRKEIEERIKAIVQLVGKRPVLYFGARHWRYDEDARISLAAFKGGATDASTDIGASMAGKQGVGTIPHALECIFAWKYGIENAVVESTKAFHTHIDPNVPRIALVDFANKEIDDSLKVTKTRGKNLYGIRVDTCGENTMQGSVLFKNHKNDPYWHGTGVTIGGVYALRKKLIEEGFPDIKIILSSGFGNREKVKAFVDAEKELKISLFDALGVGQVFPVRAATMDIVAVGETRETMQPMSKIGRSYNPNSRLVTNY